ncbi:hypothetical protein GCM10011369_36490 [Neiella marina]|uniref:Uncharacterized protein n=1 Tax=Neiella marina TaxID=508461 RepID=A0A8J2UAP4_9GAMM|nr:hypothetical protein [Neiella marina]GGA91074.1 hypothetical protein GCM10011369_36490 [Neiella marina]
MKFSIFALIVLVFFCQSGWGKNDEIPFKFFSKKDINNPNERTDDLNFHFRTVYSGDKGACKEIYKSFNRFEIEELSACNDLDYSDSAFDLVGFKPMTLAEIKKVELDYYRLQDYKFDNDREGKTLEDIWDERKILYEIGYHTMRKAVVDIYQDGVKETIYERTEPSTLCQASNWYKPDGTLDFDKMMGEQNKFKQSSPKDKLKISKGYGLRNSFFTFKSNGQIEHIKGHDLLRFQDDYYWVVRDNLSDVLINKPRGGEWVLFGTFSKKKERIYSPEFLCTLAYMTPAK